MKLKEIEQLIKMIDESNLSEFHIEQEDIKLTIKKEIIVRNIITEGQRENVIIERPNIEIATPTKEIIEENFHIIKSPIVGVFYAAANPDSEAFAKVGDKVKAGHVLCIIEAMKLMNEITSDIDGEIIEILIQNQDTVEFGQGLFKIRKS